MIEQGDFYMKNVVNFFDDLPYFIKIILALPFFDGLSWGVYRICKGHLISGIVWIFLGFSLIGSIIDLFTLIVDKKVYIWAN